MLPAVVVRFVMTLESESVEVRMLSFFGTTSYAHITEALVMFTV